MNTPEHPDHPGHPTLPAADDPSEPSTGPAEERGGADDPGPLSWPPPGLGRVRGDAYLAARWLAAGSLLILPLLGALVLQGDPWTLGIGDGFWVAVLLGMAGIPVMVAGFLALTRLMDRSKEASKHGYGWRLIALAACDQRGDTGFLVQGERVYSILSEEERRWMAGARVVMGGLFVGGAMWLSLGFSLAVVLAARGALGPGGVAAMTLLPSLGAAVVGLVLYAWEETVLRRARKAWHARPWSAELEAEQIRAWKDALAGRVDGLKVGAADSGGGTRGFRVAGVAVTVAMMAAFVPIFLLIFASTVAPIAAMVSMPSFERTQVQAANAEPLRRLALESNPSISEVEAGEILHVLAHVGRDGVEPGLRAPVRDYADPLLPDPPATLPAEARRTAVVWFLDLMEQPDAPLEDDQLDYLRTVAAHPAHAELARLARAPALDAARARWQAPLVAHRSMWSLPLPSFASIRMAAYAHIGKAALEAREGDYAAAETTVREVLSAGILLSDHGTTLLENLIGAVLAGLGADALERLWTATGRTAEAEALARERATAERSAAVARAGASSSRSRTLRALPDITLDTLALTGLRWETFALVSAASPCMNPRRIVFGPDRAYRAWVDEVREGLVSSPAQAELFELARQGGFGEAYLDDAGVLTRFVTLTMGGVDRDGTCGRTLASILGAG